LVIATVLCGPIPTKSCCVAGGAATLTTLISGFSVELSTLLVAAIITSYTFTGGLGAFFYMSYFNSASILIFIVVFLVKVFYDYSPTGDNMLGLRLVCTICSFKYMNK